MLEKLLSFYRSTFGHALVGAVLLWAALPPLDLWPLAWLAPIWWIRLVRFPQLPPQPEAWPVRLGPRTLAAAVVVFFAAWLGTNAFFLDRQYSGYWMAELLFWPIGFALLLAAARLARSRPYFTLWLVGMAFWAAVLHWLRLPHWATGFGWLALAVYFGCYLPLFVAICRAAVHRLRVPVILAAPIVFTGLELARAYLLTGMPMANLAHTQYRWVELIQVSDLAGAYAVSFVMVFVAACMAAGTRWPLALGGAMLAAVLVYGHFRTLGEAPGPALRVGLIQGSVDIQMQCADGTAQQIYDHYFKLALRSKYEHAPLDLMVWPESMFPCYWITRDDRVAVPPELADMPRARFEQRLDEAIDSSGYQIAETVRSLGVPTILGVSREHWGPEERRYFNTAVYLTPERKEGDRSMFSDKVSRAIDADRPKNGPVPARPVNGDYDKMHLVMFGEYVPWAESLPLLKALAPTMLRVTPGEEPAVFTVRGGAGTFRVCPNICYESVMPQVIRRQVNLLRQRGEEPDVLVNLTNDGWYWGSSELDTHFVCAVFRAVECRKPVLIAANTGISGWIDSDGRVLARGPRRESAILLAEAAVDGRRSPYMDYGDWPAGGCLAISCLFAVGGMVCTLWRKRSGPS